LEGKRPPFLFAYSFNTGLPFTGAMERAAQDYPEIDRET